MKVSAIVLAAGASRRFGPEDKLASLYHGKPLLYWALTALKAYPFDEIVLVIREGQVLPDLSDAPDYRQVMNPEADDGMASSIVCGISTLEPCDAAFVVLGDMPKIPSALYRQMKAQLGEADIVQPVYQDRPGHPVLFAARTFDDLRRLKGDEGARSIISSGHYSVKRYEVDNPGIHFDIDRPD